MKNTCKLAIIVILFFSSVILPSQANTEINNSKLRKSSNEVIPNRYIVVTKAKNENDKLNLKQQLPSAIDTARQQGAKIHHEYDAAINGFAATLSESALKMMLQRDDVIYIEPDAIISIEPITATKNMSAITTTKNLNDQAAQTQNKTAQSSEKVSVPRESLWNLERISTRSMFPLFAGSGVHAYIIDSGIDITHWEFKGRASHDFSAIEDEYGAGDCNGHGTHVAGTVGGKNWGVANYVRLHSVRVIGCGREGSLSDWLSGINWVVANHQKPAVVNMSNSAKGEVLVIKDAVRNGINKGITFVVSAGNEQNISSCNITPASVYEAITVGAINSDDEVSKFSSAGPCVDILAPGEDIVSAWIYDPYYKSLQGTSMAAPHVTGIVAQYLASNPRATPFEVTDAILRVATIGRASKRYGEPDFIAHVIYDRDCLIPVHRYATPGNHFYTTGWLELGGGRYGYTYEGVIGYAPGGCFSSLSKSPIHRYWNGQLTDRFYTSSFAELGNGGNGWSYEGATFALYQSSVGNVLPLYRYYSPVWTDHFYTTNFSELGNGNAEWKYEGVLRYLVNPSIRR